MHGRNAGCNNTPTRSRGCLNADHATYLSSVPGALTVTVHEHATPLLYAGTNCIGIATLGAANTPNTELSVTTVDAAHVAGVKDAYRVIEEEAANGSRSRRLRSRW